MNLRIRAKIHEDCWKFCDKQISHEPVRLTDRGILCQECYATAIDNGDESLWLKFPDCIERSLEEMRRTILNGRGHCDPDSRLGWALDAAEDALAALEAALSVHDSEAEFGDDNTHGPEMYNGWDAGVEAVRQAAGVIEVGEVGEV